MSVSRCSSCGPTFCESGLCADATPGFRQRLAAQTRLAVFGAFDGVVTALGAVFPNQHDPHALMLTCVGLAAAGAVSMGGGELVSDSEAGLAASTAIGLTTGAGTLVPAAPYLVTRGIGATLVSIALCVLVAGGIAWLKSTESGSAPLRAHAARVYGVLAVAVAVTLLCAWATGAVG